MAMVDAPETESAAASNRFSSERPAVADSLREATLALANMAQSAGLLLAAKLDQLKLSIRALILYAVLGVLGILAASTVVAVSVVLLFVGAAHGLGAAMGGRDWLGDLIVSALVLAAIAIVFTLGLARFKTASRRRTMLKYEQRRQQQRGPLGGNASANQPGGYR